jgi:type IV secretory pathway VirB10-like protein
MKHTAAIAIAFFLGLTSAPSGAQTQTSSTQQASPAGPSLGEYARQIRREPDGKQKPKVFDNDNLPKQDQLSVVGNVSPAPPAPTETKQEAPKTPAENQPKAAAAAAAAPPSDTSNMDQAEKQAAIKQWADKIAEQQKQIDMAARELDVLQREYQLRAAAVYADVGMRLRNSAEWDKEDADYKQKIADKQKALDDAKQKLEDLQEQARKAGVPTSVREP